MDLTQPTQKTRFSREELIACGRGELFDKKRPRLPLPPLLMLDRVEHLSVDGGRFGRGDIIAEMDISPHTWFFDCHFHEDPLMPGCLGIEALWQALGFYLAWRGAIGKGRALGVGQVKFNDQILPEHKTISFHVHLKKIVKSSFVLGFANGALLVDEKVAYEAEGLKVGIF